MSKVDLKLDWCNHSAAKYAVMKWHYSQSMPVGKMVKVGVWEDGAFVGCVLFGLGNNQYQGNAYGLQSSEVCELIRVALRQHAAPVTRIVSLALKMLKQQSPGLRLVVSYADPEQGHHGGIYQGGNWVYIGTGGSTEAFYDERGERIHSRSISASGTPKNVFGRMVVRKTKGEIRRVKLMPKYKYLYPLDDAMRKQIAPLAKPYPKRARSSDSGTSGIQPEGGGATPTRALSSEYRGVPCRV